MPWRFDLTLSAWGRGGSTRPVGVAGLAAAGNRIEYQRGALTEWYVNDPRGLEQGFTLGEPPEPGVPGPVTLEVLVSSDLIARGDGPELTFGDATGSTHLRYAGLQSWDASGRRLPSRMELRSSDGPEPRIALLVDDAEAVYPITIDPLMTAQVAKLVAADGAATDLFGNGVSISGETVAVGSVLDDDLGAESGSAYIYARNQGGADNWGQVAKLTAADGAAGDQFGFPLAVSGDRAVVGAFGADGVGVDSGAAYVFARNQGGADAWGQVVKLTAADAAGGDWFGWGSAISGDTVVVGARMADALGLDSGAAYVFERNQGGADNWGQVAKLTAADGGAGDDFGFWVAVSADTIVVGADRDADAGADTGAAYVFERNQGGADNWGQVAKLTAADAAAGDFFGSFVSIDVDTVIVGAPFDDDGGADSGSAYVFERNQGGADNWGQVAKLTAEDPAAGDLFGAVSIQGDTAVVGARADDDAGLESGSVYVFERNQGGADNWGQVAKFAAGDGAPGDEFGVVASISGDTVVAGARFDDDAGAESGSAYVFELTRGPGWGEIAMPLPGDPNDQSFGDAVSIDGDTAVVGARNPNTTQVGAVYVFRRNQGGGDGWGQVAKLTEGGSASQFGWSVSISGDTLVASAPLTGTGSAYVFERNQGGADSWGQVMQLSASDGSDQFGHGVSIDGDTIVVGARLDDHAGQASGAAYVYARNQGGADNWGEVAKLVAADAAAFDRFGVAVSIDGDAIVVGADGAALGAAYVFERNQGGIDNWGQIAKLVPSVPGFGFGSAVSIDGDTIAVGDDGASPGGAVYLFERNQGGAEAWGEVIRIVPADAAAGDFGDSVSIAGDRLVVGDPADDEFVSFSGAAYVFERNQGGADAWGPIQKLKATSPEASTFYAGTVATSGARILVGAARETVAGVRHGSAHVFAEMDPANLSVTKSDSPDPVDTGATLRYTIAVNNTGPLAATNLSVADSLPSEVSLVAASGTGWNCGVAGSVVTCTRPLLGVGAAPPITIDVTPEIPTTITNGVRVRAWTYDPDFSDNEVTETTTATGACLAPPSFTGVDFAFDAFEPQCAIDVAWSPASPQCGTEVIYAVYRDTAPAFVPSDATRVASGLAATSYRDASGVAPGVTYHYIVRATDLSNGAEDTNVATTSAAALGCVASAPAGHEFFNVRSGSTENTLHWVNPVAGFASTLLTFRTDTFPTGPTDPMATTLGSFAGLPGDVVTQSHGGLTDGTTYFYAAFADDGTGLFSAAKTSWGRPDSTAGAVKWRYTAGQTALAVAGVIPNGTYYSVTQDRVFNAMSAGTGGGSWPGGWKPLSLNDAAQGRPTVGVLPATTVGGASRIALAGAQDGRVYAVNAATGALLWASPVLGAMVQASPVASLTDFGGAFDLVLVGTRDAGADNRFYGLNLADGSIAWTFDNGGGVDGIGMINARARVDAPNSRVYFTSNERAGGSADTVWCLSFDGVSATKDWSVGVGDVNAAITRRGNILYVGDTAGEVHALDVSTGGLLWTHPSALDGPVKDLVLPDFSGTRLFFSTNSLVHAIDDDGGSASVFWSPPVSVSSPSPPFLLGGQVYVGADMGRLYKIDGTMASPPAPTFVVLGDPAVPKVVGTPTFDNAQQLLVIGTDEGRIYGVALPF